MKIFNCSTALLLLSAMLVLPLCTAGATDADGADMSGAAGNVYAAVEGQAPEITAEAPEINARQPETNIDEDLRDALGAEAVENAVPDEAADVLDGLSIDEGIDLDAGLGRLWESLKSSIGSVFGHGLRSAALILIVALLCSLAGSVYDGGSVPDYVPLAGALAIAAVAAVDINSFIGLGTQTLQTLSDFSKVLLPTLATAATASGAVTSATAKYVATSLFMDLLLNIGIGLIMPMIYAYIAATLANAAAGGESLKACSGLLKGACTILMSLLVIAFTAYLGITGVVSGSADAVTTRLAKTTLSTALPVVGGIISDAAGTLVAGASMLRNSIGVFGMLAVLSVCLMPVLNLGVHYLMYKAAAGLASALSDNRLGGLIGGIGTAFGMVLSLVGVGAIFMFISIISSIKAVTGT